MAYRTHGKSVWPLVEIGDKALPRPSHGRELQPVTSGYGACSSCSCQAFVGGSDNICGDCGHAYESHLDP